MLTNSITDKLYVCIVPSTEGKRRKKEKEKKKSLSSQEVVK